MNKITKIMKKIIIVSEIVFFLCLTKVCIAQNSIKPILTKASDAIKIFEDQGYETVHLDFNILTLADPSDETRRSFNRDFSYVIFAYGDQDRLNKIEIELYVAQDKEWKFVDRGAPISENAIYTSYLTLQPEDTKNYLVKVVAKEFNPNSKQSRFFFAVGNKSRKSAIESSSRETVTWNIKSNKFKYDNYQSIESTFELNVTDHQVVHTIYGAKVIYYIKEKVTTEEQENAGVYIYTCETTAKTPYLLKIDTKNKQLMLIKYSGKKVEEGYVYFLKTNIL